jgi:hypothetical protein
MQLGSWGNQITAANWKTKMLCFKFGSAVGIDLTGTTFALSNIKFNPTVGVTITTTWSTVPYASSVSHTLANVQAGRGDPCRLVGLTVEQVKAGVIDNKLYRLPTLTENQTFYGSASPNGASSTWTANGANAANPGTRKFNAGTANGAILPAAGNRDATGAVANQGTGGNYWGSTPGHSSSLGTSLNFLDTGVWPSSNNHPAAHGFPVRCVPQS